MYVLVVRLDVQPEHREAFIDSMLDDAWGSVTNEPGCLRFDVIQDQEDPNRLYLYEVYQDRAAFEAHLQAPHFIRWRDTVRDWYVERPQAGRGSYLFRTEDA